MIAPESDEDLLRTLSVTANRRMTVPFILKQVNNSHAEHLGSEYLPQIPLIIFSNMKGISETLNVPLSIDLRLH